MSNEDHVKSLHGMLGVIAALNADIQLTPGMIAESVKTQFRAMTEATRAAEAALASRAETFDPQAVRELLEAIDTMQAGGALIAGLLAVSRRVRESEKK